MKPPPAGATHVALLRGINVGRAKRVAMADLRALVEGLGYTGVKTLLNSGNVVFSAPGVTAGDAAERIEKALEPATGGAARVTVLTAETLAAVARENPLTEGEAEPSRFLVAFVRDAADLKPLSPLTKEDWGKEKLAVGKHAAYVWAAGGILESRVAEAVGRALGDRATTRNWATVTKLLALTGAAA